MSDPDSPAADENESKEKEEESDNPKKGSLAAIIAYPVVHETETENKERGNWANAVEFILASLGYAIGVGNIWRFPYITYKYGGGTFLFVYWVTLFLIAVPTFFLELVLGQFHSSGPSGIFRNLIPAFEGLGYATIAVQTFTTIYYNAILTWSLFYAGASFTSPWKTCDSHWNSPSCFALIDYASCTTNETHFWYLKARCYEEGTIEKFLFLLDDCIKESTFNASCNVKFDLDFPMGSSINYVSTCIQYGPRIQCLRKILRPNEKFSSEEFFNAHLRHPDATIYDMKGFYWPLPLVHILSWILVCVAVSKGIIHKISDTFYQVRGICPQWIGKMVYVTATFPVIMMLILVIFSTTLDGHYTGVQYYVTTNFCQLKNPELWLTAMGQIFFSLSIGGGGLMTLASYNKFHNDLLRDALIVAFGNCIFSFVGGFGIFGIVGFMAKKVNAEVSDVLRGSSESLVFVTLAQATTLMPASGFWAFLFFLMLAFLAVDSSFAQAETVITWLVDDFAICRKWRKTTVVLAGLTAYLLGLPEVSRYGSQFVSMVDLSSFDYLVPLCTVMELVLISYIYGIKNFMKDVSFMFSLSATTSFNLAAKFWNTIGKWYFVVTWLVTAPVGVTVIIVLTILIYYVIPGEQQDILTASIFWSIAIGTLPFFLISTFIWNVLYRGIPLAQLFKPTRKWGPALNDHRKEGNYELLPEKVQ